MPELFGTDIGFWQAVLFLIGGIVAGIINTLAGSGSLITLPIFVFVCGLPAPVANGTNRIGVMIQSAVGLAGFRRNNLVSFEGSQWAVVPALAGALVGTRIAVELSDAAMNMAIGMLMVVMLFFLLIRPERWLHESARDDARSRHPLSVIAFFAIGVYGGFIQAGVGLFLLAALVMASRYVLTAANGIKQLIVLAYCVPTLIIFFMHDQVHLAFGIAMALAQAVGAMLAVRFASRVPNAAVWTHRLLIATVVVSAVSFLL